VGEVHHPRKQIPSETPRWLVIPERGLFTGIAIVGAVGSGKTASCMYPFAEEILAYRAEDKLRPHQFAWKIPGRMEGGRHESR